MKRARSAGRVSARRVAAWTSVLLAAGCVPLPPGTGVEPPRRSVTPVGLFPGLDPGHKTATGLHFQVFGYGSQNADRVLETAEELYNRVMQDSGLYSFKPPGLYSVVVYGSRDEYLKKTRLPEWSGAWTVGNAMYLYDTARLPADLAHEMTHLIFHEYMVRPRPELRWLNEGLAVYEEGQALDALLRRSNPTAPASGLSGAERQALRDNPIGFELMSGLVPANESERAVNLWYRQVGDVLRFILERGGRNGMSAFLSALREGRGVEESLRQAYPGVWSGLADLESAWRRGL